MSFFLSKLYGVVSADSLRAAGCTFTCSGRWPCGGPLPIFEFAFCACSPPPWAFLYRRSDTTTMMSGPCNESVHQAPALRACLSLYSVSFSMVTAHTRASQRGCGRGYTGAGAGVGVRAGACIYGDVTLERHPHMLLNHTRPW